MSWLRRTSFALALGGAIAACTLIDPLDDVSGGAPKNSGKKDASSTSSSGSAGDDDDDATTGSSTSSSSGTASFTCPGQKEHEPNDAVGQESLLSASTVTSCGTLEGGAADVDRWKFANTTGKNVQITVTIDAPSDLRVSMQSGSNQTSGNAGGTNFSTLGASETLTLTLSAPPGAAQDIAYRIFFTVN